MLLGFSKRPQIGDVMVSVQNRVTLSVERSLVKSETRKMIAKSTKPAASGASSSRNTGRKTVSVSNRVKNNASYTFPSGYANRDCRSIYLFACLLCDLPISDEDDKLQLADRLAEKFHEYFEYRPER